MSRVITQADVEAAARDDLYWTGRWSYLSAVAEWATEVLDSGIDRVDAGPGQVLEIGAYSLPVVTPCDTMDVRHWAGLPAPTFYHDAGAAPWPIADRAYDLVIACQVLEHLTPRPAAPRAAFDEMARVARWGIVSLPWRWQTGGDHAGIDQALVDGWSGGRRPARTFFDGQRLGRKALLYDFDDAGRGGWPL